MKHLLKFYITFQRLKDEERRRNAEWARQANAHARAGELIERQKQRTEAEIRKQMLDENNRLAQEQKSYQNFLDRQVYTNEPTSAYFLQFNTTTR